MAMLWVSMEISLVGLAILTSKFYLKLFPMQA
jgi:hypothetical protein